MSTDRERVVLVTGGAGFVGSRLVRTLLDAGARVEVIDNLLSSERENLPEASDRLAFTEASLTSPEVVRSIEDRFDYVFHLVTYHGNQSSIADPIADHDNNLLPSLVLFERMKGFRRLKRLVYSGAGCVVAEKTFDGPRRTREDTPVSLSHDSPYQISKLVGELYGNYYHKQHGLPFVRARFQNVYGPGEVLGAGRWRGTPATVWRNVVPTFVWRALNGQPLVLEGGGRATRDFVYVDDVVRGLLLCAERGEPGGVYNLASGVETEIRELATAITRLAGSGAPFDVQPPRPWDRSGRRVGDPKTAADTLGFEASVSLEEGLARTIAWTRENQALIARCIAKHAGYLGG